MNYITSPAGNGGAFVCEWFGLRYPRPCRL